MGQGERASIEPESLRIIDKCGYLSMGPSCNPTGGNLVGKKPSGLKPAFWWALNGTAEAVPSRRSQMRLQSTEPLTTIH